VAVLVATAAGVLRIRPGAAPEPVTGPADAVHLTREGWALAGGVLLRNGEEVARLPEGLVGHCVLPYDGTVHVGTSRARVLALDGAVLLPLAGFDAIPARDEWYTPWGDPPDVRSMAALGGALFVNVHVGGVWRSDDAGQTWAEVVDVKSDTHDVVADEASGAVVAAAAVGVGQSGDGGRTFDWTSAGLHGSYCRAAAVAGEWVLATASTGPFTRRAAVYRRLLAGDGAFERCTEWLPGNVDTHHLAASGPRAAFGTADGRVYWSTDAGATWDVAAERLPPVRCVVLEA
jgi:hypothetical protein